MKPIKAYSILTIITIAIGALAYASYSTGYKKSKQDLGSLLMTMNIDSNIVTTGLYEELPNNLRRTMHFFIEDTPTIVNDVKIFAEVKYVTIGDEVISIENGEIWNFIKREKVFQRKFDPDGFNENEDKIKKVPDSPFAYLEKSNIK